MWDVLALLSFSFAHALLSQMFRRHNERLHLGHFETSRVDAARRLKRAARSYGRQDTGP
jgi:hypothetical protein